MLNYTRSLLVSIQVKWREHHRSQTSRVSILRDVLWEKKLEKLAIKTIELNKRQ